MALHKEFPRSPYEVLNPDLRWFPAAEELCSTAYEKLPPPLVAKVREGMGVPRKIVKCMREHNGTEPVLIEDGERFTLRLLR